MESNLTGTVALVTGASSGIGAATARQLAEHGAAVALVARRRDRLEALAAELDQAGGTALAVDADITDRTQAEAAVQQTVERFGGLDTLVNNAGLMLLGPVVGADTQASGTACSPATPRACSPPPGRPPAPAAGRRTGSAPGRRHRQHQLDRRPRRLERLRSVQLDKVGVNGFTESLRQEVTQRHLRVGVLEPGGVATELGSHNKPEVRNQMIDPFLEQTEVLAPEEIADGVAYMVTRPRHTAIGELWIMPTDQV